VLHPKDHDDDYDNDNDSGPPAAFHQDNQVSFA